MNAAQQGSHGATTATAIGRAGLHVGLPLVLGVLAYVAWRSTDVRVVAWVSRIAPHGASAVRNAGSSALARVPALIAGSLPDAAWGWAFGAALALVWRGRSWREKRAWMGSGAMVALAAELGQAVHVVPGTYDHADLAAIALGYVLGALLAGRAA